VTSPPSLFPSCRDSSVEYRLPLLTVSHTPPPSLPLSSPELCDQSVPRSTIPRQWLAFLACCREVSPLCRCVEGRESAVCVPLPPWWRFVCGAEDSRRAMSFSARRCLINPRPDPIPHHSHDTHKGGRGYGFTDPLGLGVPVVDLIVDLDRPRIVDLTVFLLTGAVAWAKMSLTGSR
jgi:hypothetical protein